MTVSAACLAIAGSCSLSSSPLEGRPVRDVHEGTDGAGLGQLRLAESPVPGAMERTRPIIYPPKVFAVYVPEHLDADRDMKIGAHWVYIKLRDSSWMEELIDREPQAQGTADPAHSASLRNMLGAGRLAPVLVPYGPSNPEAARGADQDRSARRGRGEKP